MPAMDIGQAAAASRSARGTTANGRAGKATREYLVHRCRGDDRPECPIIESLAGDAPLLLQRTGRSLSR